MVRPSFPIFSDRSHFLVYPDPMDSIRPIVVGSFSLELLLLYPQTSSLLWRATNKYTATVPTIAVTISGAQYSVITDIAGPILSGGIPSSPARVKAFRKNQ